MVQSLYLNDAVQLVYHQNPDSRSGVVESRCYFQHNAPGLSRQLEDLCAYIATLVRPLWQVEFEVSADWVVFHLKGLAEQRQVFYRELLIFFQSIPSPSADLLSQLSQQNQLKRAEKSQVLQKALSDDFCQLALQYTSYDAYFSESQGQQDPEQLMGLLQNTLAECPVYLHVWDTLPLAAVLQEFQLSQYAALERAPKKETPIFMPTGFRQLRQEREIQGAYVYWGFLLPGIGNAQGLIGFLLKHWLKLELTKMEHALHIEWLPFHSYALLSGHFYLLRAHEIDKYTYQFIEMLKDCFQAQLTPESLQKAIHSAQAELLTMTEPLGPLEQVSVLLGECAADQFLKHIKFKRVKQFFQHYLTESHLSLLQVCPPQIRTQPFESLTGLLPKGKQEPYTLSIPQPADEFLTQPKVASLAPGNKAHIYPFQANENAIGIWFSQGSTTERISGETALLFQLLKLQLQALDPAFKLESYISSDFSWLRCTVPVSQSSRALAVLKKLFNTFQIQRQDLDLARLILAQEAQESQLKLSSNLERQFWQMGFNHHPYARDPNGDYHSLRQVTPEDLQVRFQSLFSLRTCHPMLLGTFPLNFLEQIEGVFPIFEQENIPVSPQIEVQPRRGDIFVHHKETSSFSLQGQLFTRPLPETLFASSECLLHLFYVQLKTRWKPVCFQMSFLKQAWLYYFYAPSQHSFHHWHDDCIEKIKPLHLEMIKRQRALHWRQRQNNLDSVWRDYILWQSLGYSWDIYLNLSQKMLKLQLEDLERCLNKVFVPAQANWLHLKLKS